MPDKNPNSTVNWSEFHKGYENDSIGKEGKQKIKEISAEQDEPNLNIHNVYGSKKTDEYEDFLDYIPEKTVKSGDFTLDQLMQQRAENQSNGEVAVNKIGQFAVNILPQITSGFASMVDIPAYFDAEHGATNSIVKWADSVKQWSQEAMPSYRENPDKPMDFGDFAWWADSGEGLVESIASFLAQGAGIAKGLSIGGKALSTVLQGKKLASAIGMGLDTQKVLSGGAKALTTAAMLNQSEATIEATQVYSQTKQYWLDKGYSDNESKEKASLAAATTYNINRMNILLNLTSASAFLSPMKLTRQMLTSQSGIKTLGKLIGEGSQEAVEELVNHVGSQAGKAIGRGENYTFEDAVKDMKSGQGVEAALLGAIGGIGQTGGTSLYNRSKFSGGRDENGNRVSNYQRQNERYQNWQSAIEEMKINGVKMSEAFMSAAKTIDLMDQREEAAHSGDQAKFDEVNSKLFESKALESFKTGTAHIYEQLLKSVQQEEGADEMGITKDQIDKAVSDFRQLEAIYNNHEEKANVDELFYNRASKMRNERILNHLEGLKNSEQMELTKAVQRIANKYLFNQEQQILNKKDGVVTSTEKVNKKVPLHYSLSDITNNTGDTTENKKIYDQFLNEVKNLPSYINHEDYKNQISIGEDVVNALDHEYTNLNSPEKQEEAKLKQEKLQKEGQQLSDIAKLDDVAKLEQIKNETENPEIKKKAQNKIDSIKAKKDAEKQDQKESAIKNSLLSEIVNSTKDTVNDIENKINTSNISDQRKRDLLQNLEQRKLEFENDIEESGIEAEPQTNTSPTLAPLHDSQIDSGVPGDFLSNESEVNVPQEVLDVANHIKEDILAGVDADGKPIYDFYRSKSAHDRLGFLSRDYVQIDTNGVVTRKDIDNKLIDANKKILDRDYIHDGSKVTLKPIHDYDGLVYAADSLEKEKVKWEDRKKEIGSDNEKYNDEVPIGVFHEDGSLIAYIHDLNWVSDQNLSLSDDEIEQEKIKLKQIRNKILSTTELITTTIESINDSNLFLTHDKKAIDVSEALPDVKVKLAIGDGNGGYSNSPSFQLKNPNSSESGRLYAFIPLGKEGVAVPLSRKPLSSNIAAKETIIKVVEAYLKPDEVSSISLIEDIKNQIGVDISDIVELRNFISKFIYLFPTNNLSNSLSASSESFNSSNHIVAITGNAIEFGRPSITPDGSNYALSLSRNTPTKNIDGLLKRFSKHLDNVYFNADKKSLGNDSSKVVILLENGSQVKSYYDFVKENFRTNVLSMNIGTEENPKYTYTIQPSITYDVSFANTQQLSTAPAKQNDRDLNEEVSEILESLDFEKEARLVAGKKSEYSNERLIEFINEKPIFENDEHTALVELYKRALEIRSEENIEPEKIDLSDGSIWEIDPNDVDLNDDEDYLPALNDNLKEKLSNELDRFTIDGLTSEQQYDLIGFIASTITKAAIDQKNETGESKFDPSKIFENKKSDFEKIRDSYLQHGLKNKAEKFTIILNNYNKVKKLVNEHLAYMSTGRVSDSEIDNSEDSSGGLENVLHSDDWTLTLDSKSTASAELKKFFSFIENKENGLTKKSALGFPEIVPFDLVYNTLHEILAGLPSDYKMIEDRMTAYTDIFPWIQSVIEQLDEAPEHIKNEFVSDMTKHAIQMKFVMWKKNKNNSFDMVVMDSNSSSNQKRLISMWKSNIKSTDLMLVNDNGEYEYNSKVIDSMLEQVKSWKKQLPSDTELLDWLSLAGAGVSLKTISDLRNGLFRNKTNLKFNELFTNTNGLFTVLAKKLEASKGKVLNEDSDSNFLNDNVIRSLATLEATNNPNVFSNSFQSGVKTVYSFSNNKFVVNRVRDLAATDGDGNLMNEQLIDDLLKTSFASSSIWLNQLKNNPEFRNRFSVSYLSLEALKKQFSPSKDDRKLNQLSEVEHEVIKLALFFNSNGDKNERKVSFFYPTMSDKSTMMIINTLCKSVSLSPDFKFEPQTDVLNGDKDVILSEQSLQELYDNIVIPEIKRITSKATSTISGYEPNFFYFIPSLNNKKIDLGEGEDTIINHILNGNEFNEQLIQSIKDEVQKTFNKDLALKLEDWKRLGIGQTVKNSKDKNDNVKYAFINDSYMSNPNLTEGADNARLKFAATDYVFSSWLANVEAFKTIIGDPALYAKKTKDGLEETFINIGKRLAADIAPGIELADSIGNQYYQVFINDTKTGSKNMNDSFQKEYLKKILSDDVFKKYEKGIEAADAQEYTSWKEHLHVLKQLGRITKKQYSLYYDKLNNNKRLSYSELGIVLQPIKPVYVGNKLDLNEKVDRRIYIKSSSFPLIPQLTEGMQIDKLRLAVEKFEKENKNEVGPDGRQRFVRASFNTANKVGGIKNSLNLVNEDGSIKDVVIDKSNTLVLDRENFRIQQDVPYDSEKEAINIGTQERKLLFNNILNTTGFEYNGNKDLSGEQLKVIYDNAYHQLFKHKFDKLNEQLGLVEDKIVETPIEELLNDSENGIFETFQNIQDEIKNAKNPIEKSSLQSKLENIGTENLNRINFINENFDAVVEQLVKSGINVFFDENGQHKKCN